MSLDEDTKEAFAEVDTEYGKLRYCFNQIGCEWDIKIEEIFDSAKVHDREIAVNAAMIAQMFSAISHITSDRNNLCVIESKDARMQPFCITATDSDILCEQLILPIRRSGDEK